MMDFSKLKAIGWSDKNDDFIVGSDHFSDLQINAISTNDRLYYFSSKKNGRLVKQFVLASQPLVDYICHVTLIKKTDEGFTPRLAFSVRDKNRKIVESKNGESTNIRANVNLRECHENFWELISFIQSVQGVEVPPKKFSLVSENENVIIAALRDREASSIASIVKHLLSVEGITFSQEDVNQLLKRREKLEEFKSGLDKSISDELWWQDFFENNKWIFGYGLNYQILRQQQAQPHYGGERLDGAGGQRGDYLSATTGDLSFTVLVEIKTPTTQLLQGAKEIRSGAWSLSKDLTDALSQLEANVATWEQDGSRRDGNRDRLEAERIFTVKPKGILVIGSLAQLGDPRSKRETFERFRKSIHGIDILTFDELYERARFIVENRD